MSEPQFPLPLTVAERLALRAHQDRQVELQRESTQLLREIAARVGVDPDGLGKTWAIDANAWAVTATPLAAAPPPGDVPGVPAAPPAPPAPPKP